MQVEGKLWVGIHCDSREKCWTRDERFVCREPGLITSIQHEELKEATCFVIDIVFYAITWECIMMKASE